MAIFRKLGAALRYILSFTLLTIVFFSAFYLIWEGRSIDAGVMAGLFIVLLVTFNFPEIDTFKAFSIEFKRIQETIQEAQATLEQLKQLALSSARNQFYQLSTAGRVGVGDLEPKDRLARDLNKYLIGMKIDTDAIDKAREPYIDMLRTDFFNVMRELITVVYREAVQPTIDEMNAIRPRIVDGVNMYDEDRKPLKDRADDISSVMAYLTHGIPTEQHFRDVMQAQVYRQKLGNDYAETILSVGSHLLRLYDDARKEGNLTDEGKSFLLLYGQYGLMKDHGDIRKSRYATRSENTAQTPTK